MPSSARSTTRTTLTTRLVAAMYIIMGSFGAGAARIGRRLERALEVEESGVRLRGPDELVRLLEQAVQREGLLPQPADEPAQGSQAAGELLDVLQARWVAPCSRWRRSSLGWPRSLARRRGSRAAVQPGTPNTHLSGFSFIWNRRRLVKVSLRSSRRVRSLFGLDHDVVDVGVHISADLGLEAFLHAPLVRGTCISSDQKAW